MGIGFQDLEPARVLQDGGCLQDGDIVLSGGRHDLQEIPETIEIRQDMPLLGKELDPLQQLRCRQRGPGNGCLPWEDGRQASPAVLKAGRVHEQIGNGAPDGGRRLHLRGQEFEVPGHPLEDLESGGFSSGRIGFGVDDLAVGEVQDTLGFLRRDLQEAGLPIDMKQLGHIREGDARQVAAEVAHA